MSKGQILVADTDAILLSDLHRFLTSLGYAVYEASETKRVLEVCSDVDVDIALVSRDLVTSYGQKLVERMRGAAPDLRVVLMSDFGDDGEGMTDLRCENLVKPFSHRELELILKLIFDNKGLAAENALLRKSKTLQEELFSIAGKGRHFEELMSAVGRAANSDSPVLVHGEKGTGKETVARIIHSNHLRNYRPFVSVSCYPFTEDGLMRELFGESSRRNGVSSCRTMKGKVELADGGTLYIGEAQYAPPSVQIKLIHLISEGGFEKPGSTEWTTVDVRLVFGVSDDIEVLIEGGVFRTDLYCRLADSSIALLPLRESKEAIPWIVKGCIRECCHEGSITPQISEAAMRVLCEYDWPGNLIELRSCISHAAARAEDGVIHAKHLPPSIVDGTELTEIISNALDEVEKRHIINVLENCSWNKHRAARELEISKSTLYSKINKYRLLKGPKGRTVNDEKGRVQAL